MFRSSVIYSSRNETQLLSVFSESRKRTEPTLTVMEKEIIVDSSL